MILHTNAIVLHRMKYKNSSLIARIFTEDSGKMSIIMNGAGKRKENVFGIIEPPNIIKLNYYQRTKNSLQTCKEANYLHNNFYIRSNIMHLSIALAIVEIIDKTFHENDINSEVYNLTIEVLQAINNLSYNPKLILCFFLLQLTRSLGFMINVKNEYDMPVSISPAMKSFLLELNQYSICNLNEINDSNINLIEIITLLETYIKYHLKLTKNIQSLNMVRAINHV